MAAVLVVVFLNMSDVALAAFTDLVSWPSSTRKQHITAKVNGWEETKELLKRRLPLMDGYCFIPTSIMTV